MSFAIPKNVPSFNSEQRAHEDVYWGAARRPQHNGNARNGSLGNTFNGLFDSNKSLPMYKDKPFSYTASPRTSPLYFRKRFWFFLVVTFVNFFFFNSYLRPSDETLEGRHNGSTSPWEWMKESSSSTADWELRQDAARDAFKISWDGYANNAWGVYPY